MLRIEAPREAGHLLGDVVQHRLLLEWPDGWVLDREGLPEVARADRAVELHRHRTEPADLPGCDCVWMLVDWQILKSPRLVEDLKLPAFELRLRRGAELATLAVPAWRVAVSAQVPWDARRDWLGSQRPGWQAQPYPLQGFLLDAAMAAAWAALLGLGWAWRSGRLTRPGPRPFARAWRALRRRGAPDAPADLADWLDWHRAFDQAAGRVLLADDLPTWVSAQPAVAPLRLGLQQAFAVSRQEFFGPAGAERPRLRRADLAGLLGEMARLEARGGLRLSGFEPQRGAAHAG